MYFQQVCYSLKKKLGREGLLSLLWGEWTVELKVMCFELTLPSIPHTFCPSCSRARWAAHLVGHPRNGWIRTSPSTGDWSWCTDSDAEKKKLKSSHCTMQTSGNVATGAFYSFTLSLSIDGNGGGMKWSFWRTHFWFLPGIPDLDTNRLESSLLTNKQAQTQLKLLKKKKKTRTQDWHWMDSSGGRPTHWGGARWAMHAGNTNEPGEKQQHKH